MSLNSCIPCRKRKVKCFGGPAPCATCQKSRLELRCAYESNVLDSKTKPVLLKGEACVNCRRKKKRCDAARPFCSHCKAIGQLDSCVYRATTRRHIVQRVKSPPHIAPQIVHERPKDPELICEPLGCLRIGTPPPSSGGQPEDKLFTSADVPIILTENLLLFPPVQVVGDALALAISNSSSSHMNMTFRILFLIHRFQYMLQFTNAYYHAIVNGDLSGTVVHPFFIYFANLAGCHIYQQHSRQFSLLATEAMHLRLTLAQLDAMVEEDDPVAFATAHTLMAMATMCVHIFPRGLSYMQTAIVILEKHGINLRLVERTPGFSESSHQKSSLLLLILYTEVLLQKVFGRGQGITSDIEYQFRNDLPSTSPIVNPLSPYTRRVQTILFIKDVDNLIFSYETTSAETWFHLCRSHLTSLSSHIQELQACIINLSRRNDVPNHDICVQFKYCLITSLSALAELCDLIAKRTDSADSLVFRRKCDRTLRDIMTTTRSLSEEDINFLDPFMGVCWARTVRLLKNTRSFSRECRSHARQVQTYGPDWGDDEFYGSSIDLLSALIATLAVSVCVVPAGPGDFCEKLNAAYYAG